MSKSDILYLKEVINEDKKASEILDKALVRVNKKNKLNALLIKRKRENNKMYARSGKEKQAHEKALAKKGGR